MSTMGGNFIGPRDNRSLKIFGFARKYLKFQEQKRVIGQTKGNFLIGRMTKADALINRTAPPPSPTWRNVEDTWRMIRDYLTKLPTKLGGITTV